jgi:hypothetical protein
MGSKIFEVINKIYDKSGFLEKYGGSLWVSIIIGIIMFLAISYFQIMNNLQPIKADWVNQRCKPNIMPFAGIINPPNPDDMSAFDFTSSNFSYCIYGILEDIIGIFLAPFYYLVNLMNEILSGLMDTIQTIRELFNTMRKSIMAVSEEVMGRVLNILIPLQHILIKVKDTMQKTQGVMTAGIFTLFGIYDTLRSAIGAIVEIIVLILIGLAAIIVILFIIPFGFGIPIAIPFLIIFLTILIPGIMVYIVEIMILKNMVSPLPGIPSCFVGDTLVEMNTGQFIKMKDLDVGMLLKNNNPITSIMKMSCLDDIYNLNDVLCTGKHKVKYNNTWIKCKEHPNSTKINENYDIVYCINTEKKIIEINNMIFGDYDELDNNKIDEIKFKCSKYLPKHFELKDIHQYLDGGFSENTKIELLDGHNVNIKDMEVNQILRFGERVVGIVKIDAENLQLKQYILDDSNIFYGGPNLQICDSDLGMVNTLDIYGDKINEKYIYHIITDKKSFYVDGVQFCDYNSCLDKFLDLENTSLIKALI